MKRTSGLTGSVGGRLLIALVLFLASWVWITSSRAEELRIMSFNISTFSTFVGDPATRIVQGLEPDVVLIQEWAIDGMDYRSWVDTAFGTGFDYYLGDGGHSGSSSMANGIVSRWPILNADSWKDDAITGQARYFDWAIIDLPGSTDLQVVSIHLKAGYDSEDYTTRITEATNLKALIQANFAADQYIVVGGDFNTVDYDTEPDLIAVFDSYLDVELVSCQPVDRNGDHATNVNRNKKFDWIIGNQTLTDTKMPLTVGTQLFNCGIVFDSRVFTPLSEVPPILDTDTASGDMDHCPVMKAYNAIPNADQIFCMKAENGNDYNLYLYDGLDPGDITYWDATTRNPSPIARDLWVIPFGNNTVDMTLTAMQDSEGQDINALAVMKNDGGDYNLYIYNSLLPGDWTFWDAISRNPSPLARDFWTIPAENNVAVMTRTQLDDSSDSFDELVVLKNTWSGQKLFVYNTPRAGDWTYTDAFLRNWNGGTLNFYRSTDEWYIPRSDNIAALGGMRAIREESSAASEGLISIESSWGDQNLFLWKVPGEGIDTEFENRAFQLGFGGFGTPQGQDLWIVTGRNDIRTLTGIAADTAGNPADPEGDYDVIGSLGNLAGDNNFWIWKSVQRGDTTYNQALFRQDGYPRSQHDIPNFGQPQARDFWMMPSGNRVISIAAIPAPPPPPTPTPDILTVWFDAQPTGSEWEVQFTDESWSSVPITLYEWDFFYDGSFDVMSTDKDPTYDYGSDDDFTVAHRVTDEKARTDTVVRSFTWEE